MRYVVGIDLGTSSCKVGLFDAAGRPAGIGQAGYTITRGAGGQAEQNLDDYWPSVCAAVQQALAAVGGQPEIAAVGLSGQVGTHLLIDRAGRALRPALSWQDTRSRGEAQWLDQTLGRARLAAALGIDLPPSPAWPLPRLLWLQRHEPETLARTWRILQVKDYVAWRLTGELATDASSWRGLLRLPGTALAEDVLTELGLPLDLLPRRQPPSAVIGPLTPEAAAATGLPAGTPVVTGWNDLNCGLLGTGIVQPGVGFDIGGTTEHLGVAVAPDAALGSTASLMLAPYLTHEADGATRVCYGVTSAGGGALEWYGNQLVPDLLASYGVALPPDAPERLLASAAAVPPGAGGLLFLPYLHGERAPIWDAAARGVFFGLNGGHRHGHLVRAVLEGVAFSLRHVLQTVEAAVGKPVERIYASGGPANLPLWNGIKAGVLNRPLVIPQVTHAACLGAAMLAALGAGWHANAAAAASAMVQVARVVEPDPRHTARYGELFEIYVNLYPQLRRSFAQLAAITSTEGV